MKCAGLGQTPEQVLLSSACLAFASHPHSGSLSRRDSIVGCDPLTGPEHACKAALLASARGLVACATGLPARPFEASSAPCFDGCSRSHLRKTACVRPTYAGPVRRTIRLAAAGATRAAFLALSLVND
jgi:hypothetical protein